VAKLTLCLLLLLWGGGTAAPQTPTTAPKKATTAPQSTPKQSAPAKTPTASKPKTASTSKTTSARKKAPPRPRTQQEPTPERYREIQQALIDKAYLDGPPSGVWDASSMDAMKRFQTDQKLQITGKLDALSLIRLGLGPKRQALPPNGLAASPEAPKQP